MAEVALLESFDDGDRRGSGGTRRPGRACRTARAGRAARRPGRARGAGMDRHRRRWAKIWLNHAISSIIRLSVGNGVGNGNKTIAENRADARISSDRWRSSLHPFQLARIGNEFGNERRAEGARGSAVIVIRPVRTGTRVPRQTAPRSARPGRSTARQGRPRRARDRDERIGFIDAPEIGPPNSASSAIVPPIAMAAASPAARVSVATARITNIRKASSRSPNERLRVGAGRQCGADVRDVAERRTEHGRAASAPATVRPSRRPTDHGKCRVTANASVTAPFKCAPEMCPRRRSSP